ncbi:hypothetical protein MSG28_008255 [Choristoneura fumiferana]|uniref:Uncharacterized protein n=1 Tax=Choristoneura fumiferana TaxID=7141 RepID=A0ACC0JAY9_CHOFU|nr:hypothetical protein MSG28_008255 [Choristoneura fumiferana]
MATMLKEKPRARKKTKEKSITKTEVHSEVPSIANLSISEETEAPTGASTSTDIVEETSSFSVSVNQERIVFTKTEVIQEEAILAAAQSSESASTMVCETSELQKQTVSVVESACTSQNEPKNQTATHAYKDLSHRLDLVTLRDIPTTTDVPIEDLESKLEASISYINKTIEPTQSTEESTQEISVDSDRVENAMPSAPVFEEELVTETPVEALEVLQDVRPKVQCMPLEVAMEVCGGKEIAEVRQMSEREEAIVEAGPRSGPEHPLVDLLSTFRCSVTALEQERHKVMDSYSTEEKSREALWKVEKHTVSVSEQCKCGLTVYFKGRYDHAELMKSKLPAAQLRLEGLLKDVQESYCHYQHTALLAYYQIEELIAETLQASKAEIREAIMLVLQELRMSVAAPPLLCGALRRWARALCAAAHDARDPRAVLFLIHQLTRYHCHIMQGGDPLCYSTDSSTQLCARPYVCVRL